MAGLEAEGHQLFPVSPHRKTSDLVADHHLKPSLTDLISAVRDRNYQTECWAISTATDLSDWEYHILQKKLFKTTSESQSLRKHQLKLRLFPLILNWLLRMTRDGINN